MALVLFRLSSVCMESNSLLSTAFIKLFYKTLQHRLRQLIILQQSDETRRGCICPNMIQMWWESENISGYFWLLAPEENNKMRNRRGDCVEFIAKVCFAQCSTSRLALGSPGCSVGCLLPCPEYLIKPYNAIFLTSPGSKDIKTDIPNCQIHKYTNTNTNTQIQLCWSARNTKHMLYF